MKMPDHDIFACDIMVRFAFRERKNNKMNKENQNMDLDCYEDVWNDRYGSGHEYGIKDKTFMDRGMERYLSFIGLVIQRK